MTRTTLFALMSLLLFSPLMSSAQGEEINTLTRRINAEFSGKIAHQWGENVSGVRTRLATEEPVIALTLDACGSPKGKGVDRRLIDFLTREQV